MVSMRIDTASTVRHANTIRLPSQQEDLGYMVHGLLAGLFGESNIQPFRADSDSFRRISVLGYTSHNVDWLRNHAREFATPVQFDACDWDSFAVKPMPDNWERGRRLGFEARVCPVVRLARNFERHAQNGQVLYYRKGAEMDAWLHQSFFPKEATRVLNREDAYQEWLDTRFGDAASIEFATIHSFRRTKLARRNHEKQRKTTVVERPDVVMRGELTVNDSVAFQDIVRKGIARHRAFGFGMLLLKPPQG